MIDPEISHDSPKTTLEKGAKVIADYVKTLPPRPGVYRMINKQYEVLYVGKAKNLKKRVQSYTLTHRLPNRLKRMVAETTLMEFVTTHTEVEALLLEANLIKKLSPHYNILLKDSKFFSYITITDHAWPRLARHRGSREQAGKYYGPFASTGAVYHTLTTLYKVFHLRSCSNAYFASRQKPCLQYYIKRCSAPCVGYIADQDYKDSVRQTIDFLEGKSHQVQEELSVKMYEESTNQNYERAATYRNMIRSLTQIQAQQNINSYILKDADIVAISSLAGRVCVQIFFFRGGSNYGSHSFFPEHLEEMSLEETLMAFLSLFYQDNVPPEEILVNILPQDAKIAEEAFSTLAGRKVRLWVPQKGPRRKIVDHALENAEDALGRFLAESKSQTKLMQGMADAFQLPVPPQRIEVYDNSHIQGTNAIGAMVVASAQGFDKTSYRKFTIKTAGPGGITPGDDYGMMREVMTRRFTGSLAQDVERNRMPDLLLIDGGQGQLSAVHDILDPLGITIPVVAIAKGPDRNAGREVFFQKDRPSFMLEQRKDILYFVQKLRDEAHRFAIGFHRQKRTKELAKSMLDDIAGIGPSRKRALLKRFGSAREIARAGIQDLQTAEGISASIAQKIYTYFNS
ncbi:MAG: excinuclease ABC subunit UvrC [Janthinobacterium lividum]